MAQQRRRFSVATRIFAGQVAAALVLSGVMTLLLWLDTRADVDRDAAKLSLSISTTLALDPFVIAAVQEPDPSRTLQPYAVAVMDNAHVDFITIMDTDGTRYTHRNASEIGRKFIGSTAAALRGESLTETFTGTLGPSVRAVVPVEQDGEVIAMVSTGVTVTSVAATLAPRLPFVFGAAAILVVLGSLVALLVRRYLRRMTGSLQPAELSRMVDYYEAVLHTAREGIVLVDNRRRVVFYNDEAADLLGLPPASRDAAAVEVADLDLPDSIAALLSSGERAVEELHRSEQRTLVVNQEPAVPAETASRHDAVGTVMTVRDRTEVQRLSGELESVRTLTAALHAQTHEHANRLHTVLSLLELDRSQDAIDFLAEEARSSQHLADSVIGSVGQPALAALLLGKAGQASERGVDLQLDIADDFDAPTLSSVELVSVLGNLIDNALDAASAGTQPAWVSVRLSGTEVRVSDSGRGVEPRDASRIFSHGFSTKSAGDRGFGLAVVREIVDHSGGSIELEPQLPTTFVVRLPGMPS